MSYLQQSCSNIHFCYIITGWSKFKMLAGVADQKRRIANSSHIIVSECALRWWLEKGRVSNQWQCFPSPRELPYPQRATFHAKAKVARLGLSQRYIFLCNIFVHDPQLTRNSLCPICHDWLTKRTFRCPSPVQNIWDISNTWWFDKWCLSMEILCFSCFSHIITIF